jgi:hypothetical protein
VWLVNARIIYQAMQATELLGRVYRRFPIPFSRHILPYEHGGIAQFRSELTSLRLEHIANDDPCSFRDEQASLGRALSTSASADEYDFPFEAIHLCSIL